MVPIQSLLSPDNPSRPVVVQQGSEHDALDLQTRILGRCASTNANPAGPSVPGEFVALPGATVPAGGPFVCTFGNQQHFTYIDNPNLQDYSNFQEAASRNLVTDGSSPSMRAPLLAGRRKRRSTL